MPAPAVYVPERTLPPATSAKWGFKPVGGQFGYAHHQDLALAANVNSPAAIDLLVVPAGIFTPGAGDVVATPDPQVLATGLFEEPHPPEWKDAVFSAAARKDGGLPGLLVVIGPDDHPGIGPRDRYADAMDAVRDLWIFKASIAAVYVVAPGAARTNDPETVNLPFEVAPDVIELTGIGELRSLARMVDAGPFECVICQRDGFSSKATTVVVALEVSGSQPGRQRTIVRLAHPSALHRNDSLSAKRTCG